MNDWAFLLSQLHSGLQLEEMDDCLFFGVAITHAPKNFPVQK